MDQQTLREIRSRKEEYTAAVKYCLQEWGNKQQAGVLLNICEELKKAESLALSGDKSYKKHLHDRLTAEVLMGMSASERNQ